MNNDKHMKFQKLPIYLLLLLVFAARLAKI